MFKSMLILLPLIFGVSIAPSLLLAEDVMAPPDVATSRPSSAGATVDSTVESVPAVNLQDALNAPANDSSVDVRSYQRQDGTRITEYGAKGKVYRIKVQPSGGLPAYYLYRNSAGKFERRSLGGGKPLATPSWILKEF